jgi:hypothetical protein
MRYNSLNWIDVSALTLRPAGLHKVSGPSTIKFSALFKDCKFMCEITTNLAIN